MIILNHPVNNNKWDCHHQCSSSSSTVNSLSMKLWTLTTHKIYMSRSMLSHRCSNLIICMNSRIYQWVSKISMKCNLNFFTKKSPSIQIITSHPNNSITHRISIDNLLSKALKLWETHLPTAITKMPHPISKPVPNLIKVISINKLQTYNLTKRTKTPS